jgi:hypothetical protein
MRARVRARSESREQRLEEAGVPTWRLCDLHSLAFSAFELDELARANVDPLLDFYAELAVQRRWYLVHVPGAHERLIAGWHRRIHALDELLLDLEALIRLYCERAILDDVLSYRRGQTAPRRTDAAISSSR